MCNSPAGLRCYRRHGISLPDSAKLGAVSGDKMADRLVLGRPGTHITPGSRTAAKGMNPEMRIQSSISLTDPFTYVRHWNQKQDRNKELLFPGNALKPQTVLLWSSWHTGPVC